MWGDWAGGSRISGFLGAEPALQGRAYALRRSAGYGGWALAHSVCIQPAIYAQALLINSGGFSFCR